MIEIKRQPVFRTIFAGLVLVMLYYMTRYVISVEADSVIMIVVGMLVILLDVIIVCAVLCVVTVWLWLTVYWLCSYKITDSYIEFIKKGFDGQ